MRTASFTLLVGPARRTFVGRLSLFGTSYHGVRAKRWYAFVELARAHPPRRVICTSMAVCAPWRGAEDLYN